MMDAPLVLDTIRATGVHSEFKSGRCLEAAYKQKVPEAVLVKLIKQQ